MNWDAIGTIAEIIGAIAVVATLAYLAVQIRHGIDNDRVQGIQQLSRDWATHSALVTSDENVATFVKGLNAYDELTPEERMKYLASFGRGFIYCVARKGVTGVETDFSSQLKKYLVCCRKATDLPLALGFGVKERKDVEYLTGKADIAVVGSQTIRLVDEKGVDHVGGFIKGLVV